MRHVTEINLKQLIVHILNPKSSNKLVLSQRTLPLDSQPKINHYFCSHIQNSLRDEATKAASFKLLDDSEKLTNKFTNEITELDRANTDLKTRLSSQSTKLTEYETKVNQLENLVAEKDIIVNVFRLEI